MVRDSIPSASPLIVCLQESKLSDIPTLKAKTFLLPRLVNSFSFLLADGSRGGLVMAWDPASLLLTSWIGRRHTYTTFFSSTTSDHRIAVTNVYAPADHRDSRAFLEDLAELLP